ncbi:peptidoglycan-binding domain-containing protein [Pseudorhodobacter sp. W20_MBD10_FR17]|uniref:peptidoglycan-binding domain-containing protein n=1 Tax=Pseudorhodobacter sp. W20_MBD10_FR17 TaxID=3240266 RepID=UPI003F949FB4
MVGGIIGGVIVNGVNNNCRTTTRGTTKSASVSSSQRVENREVWVALNYFGFPLGIPDGSLGPKSRGAIRQYQAPLGFAPTGPLNTWEQDLLVQSYHGAQAGGPLTAQQIASDPRGTMGQLTYRDEKLGVATARPPSLLRRWPIRPLRWLNSSALPAPMPLPRAKNWLLRFQALRPRKLPSNMKALTPS